MNGITENEFLINISKINNTATLHLSGHFTFGAHCEFKKSCSRKLSNPEISHIIIDFSNIEYLDSSALEMLLVLREQALAAKKNLTLSNPNSFVSRTFDIANFRQIFTVHYSGLA